MKEKKRATAQAPSQTEGWIKAIKEQRPMPPAQVPRTTEYLRDTLSFEIERHAALNNITVPEAFLRAYVALIDIMRELGGHVTGMTMNITFPTIHSKTELVWDATTPRPAPPPKKRAAKRTR